MMNRKLLACCLLSVFGSACFADEPQRTSERDYFSELPEVLTVTRLAQSLNETPGAVTVIDRETIRRSGARELADVLRLVPGYFVTGANGANPNALYHAPLDSFGTRNLVLIDGRSVYSSFFQGDTHRGMMDVLLEDIERIEVLRGSNSAAYGANAMFGVINVVTRHSADAQGVMIGMTDGQNGIRDQVARIGWGSEGASFRLSAGRRADHGYDHAHDDKQINQAHFRGDMRLSTEEDLMIVAGASALAAEDGYAGAAGDPQRTVGWDNFYLQGQWRRQLSATDELKFSFDYSNESIENRAPYTPIPGVMLDFGGKGARTNLEFQHRLMLAQNLRAVWGVGYKRESVQSEPLYASDAVIAFSERRLFGNLEWRLHPQWLLNAGGFWGGHSRVGNYFAPRLMANFLITPEHTLRVGTTNSTRTPSIFEIKGDVRYYLNGTLIGRTTAARGNVGPEVLRSDEIGYFGNFRDWRMTLDVRVFRERMDDRIAKESYKLSAPLPVTGIKVEDFVNNTGMLLRGAEYQLRWRPVEGTEVWFNQTYVRQRWDDNWEDHLPPDHASTLALFQKLPYDIDLSLIFHRVGAATWASDKDRVPAHHQLDVRLAYPFRIGTTRAEAALTAQAANGSYLESQASRSMQFERVLFGSIRFELQ